MPKPFDPVCLIHGKRASEHQCLYCSICFRSLTPDECDVNAEGEKTDLCKVCGAQERGFAQAIEAVADILDGKDDCAGVCREPWESLRRRLLALADITASPNGFEIEEGVGLPLTSTSAGRPKKYPFKELKIGQSVFIPCEVGTRRTKLLNRLNSSARYSERAYGGKLVVRAADVNGVKGGRVWRTQ